MVTEQKLIGLRDATPEEIAGMRAKLEAEGFSVEHVTKRMDGTKLNYNGVLKAKREVTTVTTVTTRTTK